MNGKTYGVHEFFGVLVVRAAGNELLASWKLCRPRPSCFRLFWHLVRLAASRTFCTAGSKRPIRTAMMAMTTSNSISVNAERRRARTTRHLMVALLREAGRRDGPTSQGRVYR